MIVGIVLQYDNKILFEKTGENMWQLPSCVVDNLEEAKKNIIDKCETMGLGIELGELLEEYEHYNQHVIIFKAYIFSITMSDYEEEFWKEGKLLNILNVNEWCNEIKVELAKLAEIDDEICSKL